MVSLSEWSHFGYLTQIALIYSNQFLTPWRPAAFGDFRKKKRLNAHGFAREFLWPGMLYRPGKSLKRRGKSSSLHSKKIFCLWGAFFRE